MCPAVLEKLLIYYLVVILKGWNVEVLPNIKKIKLKIDFVLAGNCNLINIKVLMLFLPRGVHSECEVLPLIVQHSGRSTIIHA